MLTQILFRGLFSQLCGKCMHIIISQLEISSWKHKLGAGNRFILSADYSRELPSQAPAESVTWVSVAFAGRLRFVGLRSRYFHSKLKTKISTFNLHQFVYLFFIVCKSSACSCDFCNPSFPWSCLGLTVMWRYFPDAQLIVDLTCKMLRFVSNSFKFY